MKIDIIIVNWNSGSQLADCLASIKQHHDGFLGRCIVVDNASSDDSLACLQHNEEVILVQAGENLGFGSACNLGAQQAQSALLLFLNPDACLYADTLRKAGTALLEDEKRAIVGVQLVDKLGRIHRSCTDFPKPMNFIAKSLGLSHILTSMDFSMRSWDHKDNRTVAHVMGAFYLMRSDLFRNLNGFDPSFFVYLEDLDLSYRAKQAGYTSYFLSEAQAYHKSGGTSDQVKAKRLFYSLQSRIIYAFKHFSGLEAFLVSLAALFIEPFTRGILCLLKRSPKSLVELSQGYFLLWRWVIKACFAWLGRSLLKKAQHET